MATSIVYKDLVCKKRAKIKKYDKNAFFIDFFCHYCSFSIKNPEK